MIPLPHDPTQLQCPHCRYHLEGIQKGVAVHPVLRDSIVRSGPPPFEWGRLKCPECGRQLYLMRYLTSRRWEFAPVTDVDRIRRDGRRLLLLRALRWGAIGLAALFGAALARAFFILLL